MINANVSTLYDRRRRRRRRRLHRRRRRRWWCCWRHVRCARRQVKWHGRSDVRVRVRPERQNGDHRANERGRRAHPSHLGLCPSVRPSASVFMRRRGGAKADSFLWREREKIARLSELSLIGGGGGGGADLSGIATQAADATDGDDGHRKRK